MAGRRRLKLVRWSNDRFHLEGLLFLPPNVTGKVPLIVDVHGGPTGVWTQGLRASRGRFSLDTGGRWFAQSSRQHWSTAWRLLLPTRTISAAATYP
jgi:dipeptidyl aminopeptidase/acylaminoacyl peptidase